MLTQLATDSIFMGYLDTYQPPLVHEFKQLWDSWSDQPTHQTATNLSTFIENNYDGFLNLARNSRCWKGDEDFRHNYDTALNSINGWIAEGCNPNITAGTSEMLKYLYVRIYQNLNF